MNIRENVHTRGGLMKRVRCKYVVCALMSTLVVAACSSGGDSGDVPNDPVNTEHIDGFTGRTSDVQLAGEHELVKSLNATNIDGHLKDLSRHPSEDATPEIGRSLEYITKALDDSGWNVQVKTFYPYMADSQSVNVALDMVAPIRKSLSTKEKRQPWNEEYESVSVGFNEGTPPADLTADVVYANYGSAADYEYLDSVNIDVAGKIVLVRYGGPQRSEVPYQAYLHDAAGVIMYSEPAVDFQGKLVVPYPEGPGNPPDGIQRGTVYRWTTYNGDPLTPGYAATEDAPLIPVSESNIAKIPPTTPIGYGAAQSLLEQLEGPDAPKNWQGALPITYKIGPGPTQVHLKIDIDYKRRPSSDIIAKIEGSEHPEESVILDVHYDTWAYGAYDNQSGVAGALELARVLGDLRSNGWTPKRTIILLFTSAEERGITGSTEWTEWLGKAAMAKVVAELTMDASAGPTFYGQAVPALKKLVLDASKQVAWPGTDGSAYDTLVAGARGGEPNVGVPGGGVDLMTYRDHFGVPIASAQGYSANAMYRYHCACDDYYSFKKFVDPDLEYMKAVVAINGVLLTRLANADALPFNYSEYAKAVVGYLTTFKNSALFTNSDGSVTVDRDIDAAQQWADAATQLEAARKEQLDMGHTNYDEMNAALMNFERMLLTEEGLPGRKWFKHQIYAAQLHNGFGLQTLPGLYDALQENYGATILARYEESLYESLTGVTQATLKVVDNLKKP